MTADRSPGTRWLPYVLPALPLVGYVMFLAERLFVSPNPTWVFVLFWFSLCAALFAFWLIKGSSSDLLDVVDAHAKGIVVAMIFVAATVSVAISILQAEYFTIAGRARDLAYYSQILWNTLQGNLLAGNLNQDLLFRPPVTSDFALHVSPFLLVGVLPIYAVFQDFLTLLIVRDLALAAAAWPLFLIAREHLGGVGGVSAVALYLVTPAVMAQAYQEFTPLQLAPLPFFYALWTFTKEKLGQFICWMLVAISMREDVAVTMVGFGVWALFARRRLEWPAVCLGVPLGWWAVSTLLVQPAFGRWGNNISEISLAGGERARWGIYQILDPIRVVGILREGGVYYLYQLLRSVAFLPVLGVEGILAAPVLAANLFYGAMSHEGIEATSRLALLPSCALVGAAVLVVGNMGRAYRAHMRVFAVTMLLLLPFASLLDGVKDTVQGGLTTYALRNDANALWEGVGRIPESASVAAPGYALPALAKRSKLFNLPQLHMYPSARPDYILVDRNLDRVTTSPELQPRYRALLGELSRSREYEAIWSSGEYVLMRKVGYEESA